MRRQDDDTRKGHRRGRDRGGRNAFAVLDRAVWASYGWVDPVAADVAEDTILSRLLALNLERAAQHGSRI